MTGWKKHLLVRSHCFLLHPRQKYLKAIMDVGFEIWVKMVQLSFVKSSGTSDKVGLQSFLFQRNYELCFAQTKNGLKRDVFDRSIKK